MAILPAARILLDFGLAPGSDPHTSRQAQLKSERCQRCSGKENIQAAVADARQDGFAKGYDLGKSERTRTEAETEVSLRAEWTTKMADLSKSMLARIDDGLTQVCTEIATTTAELLKAFFQDRLKQETVDALAQGLRETLNADSHPKIVIRGPQDLIDRLRSLLPSDLPTPHVDLLPDAAADVQITVDHTSVESSLKTWMSKLGSVP